MSSPHSLDTILYGCKPMRASHDRWDLQERRKRARVAVRWTVYLARKTDSHPFETVTHDLSSDGFYCYVPEPILPGELLETTIVIPSHHDGPLCIKGYSQVIRLDNIGASFGIGCQIREYNIVTLNASKITKSHPTNHLSSCPS